MNRTSTETSKTETGAGAVQIAIWKDPHQPVDVFGNTSDSIFFDFSKPLRIFDSPTWNSQITTQAGDDFFVLSFKEQV